MTAIKPARRALPALDLAFRVDATLPSSLLALAGAAADARAGESFWTERLGRWLEALGPDLPTDLRATSYSLGLRLSDDAAIARLNEQWRGGSGPTDVLAFAAREEAPPPPPPDEAGASGPLVALELGDIIISLETAARQSEAIGHGPAREVLFLASHGLLHLLGWDHPDEDALAAMLERQERLITLTESASI